MAQEFGDLVSALKGNGPVAAAALLGIYMGVTAKDWSAAWQAPVSVVGFGLISLSALWYLLIFVGRLTRYKPFTRLETPSDHKSLPPPTD